MTVKKRNPQDATMRNVRSLRAAIADLAGRVAKLEVWTTWIGRPEDE